MLRSAPLLRRGALLIRGPLSKASVGPGSAERRKAPRRVRDTEAGKSMHHRFTTLMVGAAIAAAVCAASAVSAATSEPSADEQIDSAPCVAALTASDDDK